MDKELIEIFEKQFGQQATVFSRAPGRLEILGNHTDYNEGVVLSCAVDREARIVAAPREDRIFRVYDARDGSSIEFNMDDMGTALKGDWGNYIKGVIVEIEKRDVRIKGFDAVLKSTLPLSSGMSSSAALEISVAYAIGAMNDLDFDEVTWAKIGQGAEVNYIGAKTGLLDQFTSIMGEANTLVHIDFRDMSVRKIAMPDNAVFVVANSGVTHDLTGDYNERRERCEQAAAAMKVPFLRDVDMTRLEASKDDMPVMAYRRALHVVGENERVAAAETALKAGDLQALGKLLLASHESSRNNFENSCEELDILVSLAEDLPGFYGGRLSGGGFGGISIHLVEKDQADEFSNLLASAFEARTGNRPATMICEIGPGASVSNLE